jgi:amino acid adenylation domain-containing protein
VGAEVVLTQPELLEPTEWTAGVEPIAVHDRLAGEAPSSRGAPDDLAYVIFTSGSTGEPKGVMVDHRAALNTILDVNRRFEIGREDRVLALSALSFDLSVWDVFGTLAAGGAIVIPDADRTRDPGHWVALAESVGVTVWNSVPALMRLALEHVDSRGDRLPDSLRLVMLSGDWIPLDLPDQLASSSRARPISLGGATEAAIWSIFHPVDGSLEGWDSVPYGFPLANQRWHILDSRGRECPSWVTGELHIAGAGLALGYWRDPQRTDAAFIERDGERLYRTGDLGRRRAGGIVEFQGRADTQVKVNGFRIELGEVEAALARHPRVIQAVCAAPGPREERRLAAYYTCDGDTPKAAELRDHVAEILPQWMIPSSYTQIDELPLNANGKVDRSRLPDPQGQASSSTGRQSPFTESAHLAGLISAILGVDRIDLSANLLDLGATSLQLVRLQTAIWNELKVEVPLEDLFVVENVEQLAERLAVPIPA